MVTSNSWSLNVSTLLYSSFHIHFTRHCPCQIQVTRANKGPWQTLCRHRCWEKSARAAQSPLLTCGAATQEKVTTVLAHMESDRKIKPCSRLDRSCMYLVLDTDCLMSHFIIVDDTFMKLYHWKALMLFDAPHVTYLRHVTKLIKLLCQITGFAILLLCSQHIKSYFSLSKSSISPSTSVLRSDTLSLGDELNRAIKVHVLL